MTQNRKHTVSQKVTLEKTVWKISQWTLKPTTSKNLRGECEKTFLKELNKARNAATALEDIYETAAQVRLTLKYLIQRKKKKEEGFQGWALTNECA